MDIFDEIIMTEAEIQVVADQLKHPLVVKYLKGMARNVAATFLETDARTIPETEYHKLSIYGQATVGVVTQLLELAVSNEPESPTE